MITNLDLLSVERNKIAPNKSKRKKKKKEQIGLDKKEKNNRKEKEICHAKGKVRI